MFKYTHFESTKFYPKFHIISSQVLDGLIEEDEDVVDTWYLLGWLNKLRADFERTNATETKDDLYEGYLGNARYYLNKSLKVQHKTPSDDTELVSKSILIQ